MSVSQYYKSVGRGFRDRSEYYSQPTGDLRVELVWRKQDLRTVGFTQSFLASYVLLVTGESISKHVLRTRAIYDRKVEFGKYFSLTSLALVKLFSSHKVLERLIVSLDVYNCICSSQVSSLLLQALNNSKQLLIIDLIVKLYKGYRFREVAYGFLYITRVLLGHNPSDYPIRGVSLDLGQESRVIVYEQGSCYQELLKLQKRYFIVVSKSEDRVLTCKLVQRLSNTSVVFNKPPIEVAESQERLNALYRARQLLISDYGDLLRVDFQALGANNKAQVFYTSYVKLSLLNIYLQAGFL